MNTFSNSARHTGQKINILSAELSISIIIALIHSVVLMQNTTNKQTNKLNNPPPPPPANPPIGISPSPVWASAGKNKNKNKLRGVGGGWWVSDPVNLKWSSESVLCLQKDRLPWMGIRLRLGMTRRCSLTNLGSSPEGQIANGRRVHVTETAGPAGYGRQAESADK